MLVPYNAFAYSGGLLDRQKLNHGTSSTTNIVTNGNTGDYIMLGASSTNTSYVEYIFPTDVANITSFRVWTGGNKVYVEFYGVNDNLIRRTLVGSDYKNGLEYKTTVNEVKKIRVKNDEGSLSAALYEFDVFGNLSFYHEDVTGLNYNNTKNEVDLYWSIIDSGKLTGFNIYRDGLLIKSVSKDIKQYKETISYGQQYAYKVTAVYNDGFETKGSSKSVKIPEPPRAAQELTEVDVTTKYNRVNLSWNIPDDDKFKHVNIYRQTLSETKEVSAIKNFFVGESVYADSYQKIFETNGTYFNDLTVKSNTEYEYKLTTMSTDNLESSGIIVKAVTPEEPVPVIVGGNLKQNENGDYVYTWDEPTTGKVIVKVGDKEYEVDASDKELIIPKEEMEYTPIGDPDVSATPISESGKEGPVTKPPSKLSEIELPFGVGDLLKTGSGLLWWIAPFVLLGLSFLLVPKLRNLIINAVRGKRREKELTETERRTKSESPEKEKIESVKTEKEPRESKKDRVEKQGGKLRSVRVRERQTKEPKGRRERALKEPKISRISRETRQPRQSSNRTREAREGRQSERVQRMPREPRQGR